MIKLSYSGIKAIADSFENKITPVCQMRSEFVREIVDYIRTGNIAPLKSNALKNSSKVDLLKLFFSGNRKVKTMYNSLGKSRQRQIKPSTLALVKRLAIYFRDPNNLKEVALCEPLEVLNYQELTYTYLRVPTNQRPFVNTIISRIFDYDEEFPDLAYGLSEDIGVYCCPYCNRNYIKEVKIKRKKGKSGIRPTFDHFLSKADFPMFALSFYNLIPSCYHCNSSLKHTAQTSCDTHLHPYIDGFGKDVRFYAKIVDLKKNLSDPSNIKIEIKPYSTLSLEKERQIFGNTPDEGNINLFGLDEIYQMHRDVAGELLMRTQRYNGTYATTLQTMFGDLKTSKEEFYRFYFGSYLDENDFHKRPLAKMTRDIVGEEIALEFDYK